MPPKKNPSLPTWIDHFLDANPPRTKSLVMTLFGDVITPHGGQVWLGSLIELLAAFGIGDRMVRTSVFRLAEEGWLDAEREGRRSRYTLDPRSAARFKRAYQRIYMPGERHWDGRWTLVFPTAGGITAEQRTGLRRELQWQGFAMIAPFVFAHPAPDPATLEDILQRIDAQDGVFVCSANEGSVVSGCPLVQLIDQYWNLDTVVQEYERFLADFAAVPALLGAGAAQVLPRQAFVVRTLMIHAFRRVNLQDAQLPLNLLPADWPGNTAYKLCRQIYRSTHEGAEQYILDTLRKEDTSAPPAADYFYSRFGGIDKEA